jgi:hypothetical protein
MRNKEFKTAYTIIERKFSDLIQNYFIKKKVLISYLNEKGYEAHEDEYCFWIGNSGRGVFYNEYEKLVSEMNKKEYKDMIAQLKK